MVEIHPGLLWLGNALEVRTPQPLFDLGIAAVVDFAYEELPAQLPRQLIYCRFPLNDGGGNSEAILLSSIRLVVDLLNSKTPTIVACSAGLSRSPTIASFALASFLGQPPAEVASRIAELKPISPNSVLWQDCLKLDDTGVRKP